MESVASATLDSFKWIEETWSFIHTINVMQTLNYELVLKKIPRTIKFNQKA